MADNSFGIKELNLVGSGTPKIQSPNNINLEAVTVAISTNATVGGNLSVSGTLTGDGSGLTGVVGSGSGIAIKHDGSIVGTAGTIDFSTNLDVSAISGAAVTITASSGGIGTDGSVNTTGIITASQFHATDKITVGSGATIEANGQANFVGFVTFKNEVEIDGMIIKDPTSNGLYIGQNAGLGLVGGQQNTGVGWHALYTNKSGDFNVAMGTQALASLGSDVSSATSNNTAIGAYAGSSLDTATSNTLIGRSAGNLLTNASGNTIIGGFTGNSGGLDIRTSTGNVVLADGSGNIKLYINSSGNVGINSVAPTSKLDVGGSISAADKVIVGSGATIEANGQASFTGIITSKSSILVEGGSTIVDIGSGNQGFYLYNGASTHLAINWSSSASRNQFRGDAGGSHPLWFEDFSDIQVLAPLTVSGNDFKVGSGVTIQSGGSANFVGIITAGNIRTTSSITCGSDLDLSGGTIRRDSKIWLLAGAGNPEYYAGTPSGSAGDHIFKTFLGGFSYEKFRIGADGDIGILQDYGTSGQVLTSNGAGSAASWTTVSGGIGTNGSVNTTGIITAASFSGVGNDIVTARWTLGANGTSDFTFTGPGFPTTQNDPVIYLARGQTYEFDLDNTGGSHPFQIQDSEDNPYTTGVTYPNGGSSATSGITTFAVPFTASNSLQYKCTSHSTMGNTIVIYPNLNV